MKELFKIEVLRKKVEQNDTPTRHEWNMMYNGGTHKVTEKEIQRTIDVVNRAHRYAISFLNAELKKLTKKTAK